MALNIKLINSYVLRTRVLKSFVRTSSNTNGTKPPEKKEEVSKESLQWRIPWEMEKNVWYSKLKAFSSDSNNTEFLKFIQTPVDFRPSNIKNWLKRRQEEVEIATQLHLPERNRILGDDLAAAHFIVFRGGTVKFFGENKWIKQNTNGEYDLPKVYVADKIIEAIDCSNMHLHYEGLENLRGLSKIKWFSVNNCEYMDDWCVDRIIGMFRDSLEYLDVRNCKNITDRSIGALYKMTKLKTLYIDDIKSSNTMELTCLMLQEMLPNLEIKS